MPAVASARLRPRYTEGSQRAEERRGCGVQSGWPATYGGGPAVVEARLRLRYTEGDLQAEELGAVVSNPCGRLKGGRCFGGFGAKPSHIPGKRKASATSS